MSLIERIWPSIFEWNLAYTLLWIKLPLFQWADTVGFAAAKMIRRILGLAHNIDLEWIEDKDRRATCEARALTLARDMMVNPSAYPTIAAVIDAARRLRRDIGSY